MKKLILIFVFVFYIFYGCESNNSEHPNKKAIKAKLENISKSYLKNLKGVLVSNMKEGGPLQAVSVCSDTAQKLTLEFALKNNVKIKRVSFKNRNPLNTPDEFETEAINQFQKLLNSGKLNKESNVFEIFNNNGTEKARFLKPILVDAPCLNCHGNDSQISEEVRKVLVKKYPEDKAINYSIGDLRGAISIEFEDL